jgi:L-ascorbate metabolism protein UlaG (beta-lactamase superfamily)
MWSKGVPQTGELRSNVLIVPIEGMMTTKVGDALRAVAAIEPAVVIPVHDNQDIPFYHRAADEERFAAAVGAQGLQCLPLRPGEEAEV